jgi:hypothetical protein
MPGLPFVRLAGPEDPMIEEQNRTLARSGAELNAELAREPVGRQWIEPNWDAGRVTPAAAQAPAQGALAQGSLLAPDAIAEQQFGKQTRLLTTQRDTAIGRIKGSLDPEYNTLMAQAQVDWDAAAQMGHDPQQLQATRTQIQAGYQKKWLAREGAVQPDIDGVNDKIQKTLDELNIAKSNKQTEIRTIQGLMDEGVITRDEGLRRQYAVVGVEYTPAVEPKPQTPAQRIQQLKPILDELDRQAVYYRMNKKTGRMQTPVPEEEWNGGTPGNRQPTDKQWRDLAPEEHTSTYVPFQREHTRIAGEYQQARQQLLGRRSPIDLMGAMRAMSPLGQSVQAARPAAPTGPKRLTRDQVLTFKAQGMTREQVEQWAKENGYAL